MLRLIDALVPSHPSARPPGPRAGVGWLCDVFGFAERVRTRPRPSAVTSGRLPRPSPMSPRRNGAVPSCQAGGLHRLDRGRAGRSHRVLEFAARAQVELPDGGREAFRSPPRFQPLLGRPSLPDILHGRTQGALEVDLRSQHVRGCGRLRLLGHVAHLVFARSSSRRSHVSRAPSSIPDWSIPSRSSMVSKRDVTVSFVLPSRSSNVAVSSMMWPGIPSNSNVETIRSGRRTSRYSPRNPYSVPSGSRHTYCHRPPFRTSIASTVFVCLRRPHHLGMSSGSVYARNTRSRGALNTRDMTTCRFLRSVTAPVLDDPSAREAASRSKDSVQPFSAPSWSGPAGSPSWRSVNFVFPPSSSKVTVRSISNGVSALSPYAVAETTRPFASAKLSVATNFLGRTISR